MSNLRLSYLQKVGGGGYLYRPSPHPKKWGDTSPPPPSPRDLRQCDSSPPILNLCHVKQSRISGVHQKAKRRIFRTLRAESFIFFTSLDKAYTAEEYDTKIVKFGWVILILCPVSWNTVIFKFRFIFATDERRIVSGKVFHMVFCGSPLIRVSFVATDQLWASPKLLMEGFSRHKASLIGRKKSSEILKWLYFKKWAQIQNYSTKYNDLGIVQQLGTFSVNGEWVCGGLFAVSGEIRTYRSRTR